MQNLPLSSSCMHPFPSHQIQCNPQPPSLFLGPSGAPTLSLSPSATPTPSHQSLPAGARPPSRSPKGAAIPTASSPLSFTSLFSVSSTDPCASISAVVGSMPSLLGPRSSLWIRYCCLDVRVAKAAGAAIADSMRDGRGSGCHWRSLDA